MTNRDLGEPTDAEREAFLKDLTELSRKHGLIIGWYPGEGWIDRAEHDEAGRDGRYSSYDNDQLWWERWA